MRICLVEFSPSGGLYQFALQLADALGRAGHAVDLLTGPDPELRPAEPAVRLLPVLHTWHPTSAGDERWALRKARRGVRAGQQLAAWSQAATHIRRERPDVVQWAEWRFALDGAIVAAIARRHPGVVMADVAHTPRPYSEQRNRGSLHKDGRLLHRALAAAYARMDVVLVLGERSREDLRAAFPAAGRVEVLPHGDEGIYAGPVPLPSTCGRTALFFGTLARYKGLDVLLDAWRRVGAARPDARLVIAGAVADIDLPALRRSAEAVGGVDLRPGYVPAGSVRDLVGAARLVVAPYQLAYQSGVVHLAHTLGRPVVASDVGDLAAVVRPEVTGLLVPPGDAGALATAMARLLDDPAEADRLGAAGQARLTREASWDTAAAQLTDLYAGLVAERHGRREPERSLA